MVINKNNDKILIEEYNERNGFIHTIKTLKAYNITVIDSEEQERLKGKLRVIKVDNRIKYKFGHNTFNEKLVNYVVKELKKHNYIKE